MPQSTLITETSPLLHDANCVYCHVDLDLGDHAVVCDRCQSPHHADCWEVNGSKCATFSCVDGKTVIQPHLQSRTANQQVVSQPASSSSPRTWLAEVKELIVGVALGIGISLIVTLVFTIPVLIYQSIAYDSANIAIVMLLIAVMAAILLGATMIFIKRFRA